MSLLEATPDHNLTSLPSREAPPPRGVTPGHDVLRDSGAIYVTPDTPPLRSPLPAVVEQTGLPLLDIRMPDNAASQGEEGVALTLLRHPGKGYGLTSNRNDGEPIFLAEGTEVVLGREGSDDPVSSALGLITHSNGHLVSRKQMTVTVLPDSAGVIIRDGWVDKDGVPHKSHQGSTVIAAEPDAEYESEFPPSTMPLPALNQEDNTVDSEQALAIFRKDHDNVVDIRLKPGEATKAPAEALILARGASRRPEGDAKDLGGNEGDWQTLLGVLDLPGHPSICLVRAAGVYHSNSRKHPSQFRQGIAAVAPAADGREPRLIGFSMSPQREIVITDDNQNVVAALRPLTYAGGFEVTPYVENAHMNLIHNGDVRADDLPNDRVWKLPFADPNWREGIQPAFQIADGSAGSVRAVHLPPRS